MSTAKAESPNTIASASVRKPIVGHIISNTHWDREWRYPFQAYRMDLVDMMDRLLDILETNTDYRAFFLDSQTVILEDYLEIRPENEERVKRQVAADRLQIGPWYTLPDEWGCPGESLVRNLLMGHRVGKKYGPITKVGYTPFSNGQISQLPQLYRGFGLDSCFFYRGIHKEVAKSEFLWEGADGSRIFGFRFADYARYNYYYLTYRPGLLGRFTTDRDYIWNPEEVPYRVASEQTQDRQYGWIDQKLRVWEGNVSRSAEDARRFTAPDATTSHLLYMMGHDHSFAATEETDLIKSLQDGEEAGGDKIIHSSLTDYMEAFRREARDLEVVKGEMRHTLKVGLWTTLMATILSCRLYLKQRNARLCAALTLEAEPLAAVAWITGSSYPTKFLEVAWKKVLVNHAHDAIGGCSVDKVHVEMMARWSEVETIIEEITRRSMRDLAARIDGSWIDTKDLQLTVFYTTPYTRSGVVDVVLDLPGAEQTETFSIETKDGSPVPVQELSREPYSATIEGGYELTMPFPVQRVRARILVENLPAMGYESFAVRRGKAFTQIGSIVTGERTLENEHLAVEINTDGTIRLTDKASGRVMDHLCYFEDTAEFGDPWNRVVPANEVAVTSLGGSATVSVEYNGPVEGALRIGISLTVPAAKADGDTRSAETVVLPISLVVSLKARARALQVRVEINNKAKDHRLRFMMPSGVSKATHSFAEGQFDVLKRPITLPDSEGWKEKPYPTHPMWNFVDVSDGRDGFGVINDGLIEYEIVDDDSRTVAVTLLRAFGKFIYSRPTPGSQCQGEHYYKFAIYPHTGWWHDSTILEETRNHVVAIPALESAPTRGHLPSRREFLSLSPGAVFSGIKQSEDGNSVVARFWNPLDAKLDARLSLGWTVTKAEALSLEEIPSETLRVTEAVITLSVDPKKIVTVGLGNGN
ncbi:MAG: hypothetical protein K1X53_16615 [Candidatus Sumerlaeaceae bacterium]|nr:hypothetical protein [Candidatus Sumerlaeaceae bacterium]